MQPPAITALTTRFVPAQEDSTRLMIVLPHPPLPLLLAATTREALYLFEKSL